MESIFRPMAWASTFRTCFLRTTGVTAITSALVSTAAQAKQMASVPLTNLPGQGCSNLSGFALARNAERREVFMTRISRLTVLALVTVPAFAQLPAPPATASAARSGVEPATIAASPSARGGSSAQEIVSNDPKDASAYTALGLALCRRGQETSDVNFYSEADHALNTALQISP